MHTDTDVTRSRWIALRADFFGFWGMEYSHGSAALICFFWSFRFVVSRLFTFIRRRFFFLLEFQFFTSSWMLARAYYTCTHRIHSQTLAIIIAGDDDGQSCPTWIEWVTLWDNDLSLICNGTNRTDICFFFFASWMPDQTLTGALRLHSCLHYCSASAWCRINFRITYTIVQCNFPNSTACSASFAHTFVDETAYDKMRCSTWRKSSSPWLPVDDSYRKEFLAIRLWKAEEKTIYSCAIVLSLHFVCIWCARARVGAALCLRQVAKRK